MKRTTTAAVLGVVLITTAACSGSDPTGGSTPSATNPLVEYLGGGEIVLVRLIGQRLRRRAI